jgi:hypothetical protein
MVAAWTLAGVLTSVGGSSCGSGARAGPSIVPSGSSGGELDVPAGKVSMNDLVAHAISELRFEQYTGLGADVSLAALLARFPPLADGPGRGALGSAQRPAKFRSARAPSAHEPLLLWYVGEDEVVRIDVQFPKQFAWREQTQAWGAPAAQEDYDLGGVVLRAAEIVWPERGITVFTNEAGSAVTRVLLYPPCSFAEYREHVFVSQPVEELP